MPTLKSATQPRDTSNMTQVSPAPTPQLPTPPFSADPEFNSNMIAPIPGPLGTSTDAARQFYRRGVSQIRMLPLPTQSSPAVGAQAASQTIIAAGAGSSGTGIDLQVNNVDNPVQNILNITGSGVSYGPGKGQVQISSGSGGDGLEHGTTPWETDPSSVIMVDDFTSGNETSGSIGQLNWRSIGNGPINQGAWVAPNLGSIVISSADSANGGILLTPMDIASSIGAGIPPAGFPLTYNTGWECSFIFRWPNINRSGSANPFTKVRLYLGVASKSNTGNETRPAKFMGLRYDTDPGSALTLSQVTVSGSTTTYTGTITGGASNAFAGGTFIVAGFTNAGNNVTITVTASTATTLVCTTTTQVNESHAATATGPRLADTTYHFECVQNGADAVNTPGTVFNTGIAPDNNWHRFRIRSIVQGQILFSLDGSTEQSMTMTTDTFPSGATLQVYGNEIGTGYTYVSPTAVSWFSAPAWGSPAVLAGCTGAAAVLNGTWPILEATGISTGGVMYLNSTVNSNASQSSSSITLTWYNSFYPIILLLNDSEGSLGQNSVQIDFFSFVYNPGLATDFSQTANPTLPRYFNGQT